MAACRHFPQHEFAIRKLMGENADFCDICDELADAEAALDRVDIAAPPHLRQLRRQEWSDLVDRLVREVSEALQDRRS
jgi:hypothetical protein